MEFLTWMQDSDGLHVTVVSKDGKEGCFNIGKQLINLLLAGTPKIYDVFVKFNDSPSECACKLDLSDLKPYISKTNGLKIPIRKKSFSNFASSDQIIGRYCLARGESYQERFLNQSNWQSQRIYFDVIAKSVKLSTQPQQTEKAQAMNFQQPEKPQEVKPKEEPRGKLKTCAYCGEIYPSSLLVCPFCNNQKKNVADSNSDEDVDLDLS